MRCLQDERAGKVAALRPQHRLLGRQEPPAVLRRAKQGSEARARIESWEAGQVYGDFTADEGSGLQVSQQCVIFNTSLRRHLVNLSDLCPPSW